MSTTVSAVMETKQKDHNYAKLQSERLADSNELQKKLSKRSADGSNIIFTFRPDSSIQGFLVLLKKYRSHQG